MWGPRTFPKLERGTTLTIYSLPLGMVHLHVIGSLSSLSYTPPWDWHSSDADVIAGYTSEARRVSFPVYVL
ncbi:hypothetical protein NDU88_011544 [Pleurodeles waltl]|uniref:Uncharacterized protein n=1 Tax=Pleurodeles waltl TaxID=8319 RepID=A0AAV7S1G3_PLEWA|nr:hypothetical protein NDU88_011544 [Pleurodeles waltl]